MPKPVTPTLDQSRPVYDPALEGLRGVAILWVIWGHTTILKDFTLADKVLYHIAAPGWAWVDLFFVLSAFLITRVILASKGKPGALSTYYKRRAVRVLPFYYAVVFFSLIVLPRIPNPKAQNFGRIAGDEPYYWLHASNFSIANNAFRHGILDNSWSLAIEFQMFVLVLPVLIWFLSVRALSRLCAAMFLGGLAFRLWLYFNNALFTAFFVLTPARFDSIAAGIFIAILLHSGVTVRSLRPTAKMLALIAGPAWFGLTIVEQWWPTHDPITGPGMGKVFGAIGYTMLGVFNAALLVLVLSSEPDSRTRRWLSMGWLRLFGRLSFALYLFHMPIRAVIRDTVFSSRVYTNNTIKFPMVLGSELPGQIIFYILSLAAALVAAWVCFWLFERPFLLLRRRFRSPVTDRDWLIDPPAMPK